VRGTIAVGLSSLFVACTAAAGPPSDGAPTRAKDGDAAKKGEPARAKGAIDCGALWCRSFATPAEAFAEVLASKPLILGVGEVHETEGAPKVRSSIAWFAKALVPALEHRASDLIAETWISEGDCGKTEEKAVEEIAEVTERPESTEDELVTLLLRAKEHGVRPHVLEVSCAEYSKLLDAEGELDAEKLLVLVTKLLLEKTTAIYEKNQERSSKRIVVIYGGAVHNDVEPAKDYADFSFGPALDRLAEGRYVELDLLVPELIERDESPRSEPWFASFERHSSTKRALLFRPKPASFVLVLPRGQKR
jgi:hypothetical protein